MREKKNIYDQLMNDPSFMYFQQIMKNPQLYQQYVRFIQLINNPLEHQQFLNYINQQRETFELVIRPSSS